ncbi:MAG TPA: hypothetical protein QGH10_02115, partial [Armatimonadota bacterium]|nr:hypothetical protein [Armatimonadota bacterium]
MIGMLRRMVAVLIASVVVVGLSADPGADGTTAGDPARLFAENPGARLPGDEGFLLRDLNRLALEWNRATLAGAYSTHGERDPERHEAALTLLELLAQHFSAKLPGASAEELTQAALPLRDTDGFVQRDPILCYAISATVSLAKAGEPDELKYLDRAIEGFRERPEYPRSRAWIAADRAVEVLR